MSETSRLRQRLVLGVLAVLWTGAIVGGLAALNRYKSTPGEIGTMPPQWPHSTSVERDEKVPTLVVFAHPLCPCTRASMTELGKLLDKHSTEVRTVIVAMRPSGTGEEWSRSALTETANRLPNATLMQDLDGKEAERFGARTSGTAALYDPRGRLLFHGGLTIARGHEGDSPGVKQIRALLKNEDATTRNTPVFGCSLLTPELAR